MRAQDFAALPLSRANVQQFIDTLHISVGRLSEILDSPQPEHVRRWPLASRTVSPRTPSPRYQARMMHLLLMAPSERNRLLATTKNWGLYWLRLEHPDEFTALVDDYRRLAV
jgi:hypothetical protein